MTGASLRLGPGKKGSLIAITLSKGDADRVQTACYFYVFLWKKFFAVCLHNVNEGQRGFYVRPHEPHDTRTTVTKLQTLSRLFHLDQLVKL